MDMVDFNAAFEELAGFPPMPWQARLYFDYFDQGVLPSAVDIPTGLGKTAVAALWLIALRAGRPLPRRLVYVVDRRAVVDQATEFVEQLREKEVVAEEQRLAISTLRGKFLDNREWLADPSRPAIVIGTVDMIGSRLLFEGYGVSRRMRPYHAGLLGVDSLVVLDESHLVPPFERLLEDIQSQDGGWSGHGADAVKLIPGLTLMSLSATGRSDSATRRSDPDWVFQLQDRDSKGSESGAVITRQRLNAHKSLLVEPVERGRLAEKLAQAAWDLSEQGTQPMRCLVYCHSRLEAEKVVKALVALAKKRPKQEGLPQLVDPELFIGARRGYERKEAYDWLNRYGYLAGKDASADTLANPLCFLVATSAGEVGVDMDADHMVCDLVPWERMVQRLGRVNRRGAGKAMIRVLDAGPLLPKSASQQEQARYEIIYEQLRALMDRLPECDDGHGEGRKVSPGVLNRLKTDTEFAQMARQSSTPLTMRPALTRPLLDAWAMTSLKEHTGRPEVTPWLRGWVEEERQTQVLWRDRMPMDLADPDRPKQSLNEYFAATPPHALEQLGMGVRLVADWLVKRAKSTGKRLEQEAKKEGKDISLDPLAAVVLNGAGEVLEWFSLADLSEGDKRRLEQGLAERTVVVWSELGGLDEQGVLNEKHNEPPTWCADGMSMVSQSDEASPVIPWRVMNFTVATEAPDARNWRCRLRWVLQRDEDDEVSQGMAVYKWRDDVATERDRALAHAQSLQDHQACAADKAKGIALRLALPQDYSDLLVLAARLHDEGKQSPRWQEAFNAPQAERPYAKTLGPVNVQRLDGYRHEFGSLFHAERDAEFQALGPDKQDLVLHLIAAHHGNARPLISARSCDEAPPSLAEKKAREVALRFVRLQRVWGIWGLAWWEALLRAADQQASRANEQGED